MVLGHMQKVEMEFINNNPLEKVHMLKVRVQFLLELFLMLKDTEHYPQDQVHMLKVQIL